MLDLQPGVDLQEEELATADQEFRGARRVVANVASGRQRGLAHGFAQPGIQRRRRRLFDDLLVAALDRALALEQMHQVAVPVAQDLDLDMAGVAEPALQEHRAVAERGRGFAPRALDGLRQFASGD
jgi:hypothetical protein